MPIGDVAPEIALLLGGCAALVLALFLPQRAQWLCGLVAALALVVAAGFAWAQIEAAKLSFKGVWALDGATGWARLLILAATALCLPLCPRWFTTDRRHGEFYIMLLFSALGAVAMAGAADLLQLLMAVLLSSVTGYAIAAWHRDWALSVEAGMKYFLVGALANAMMAIGVVLLLGMLGSSGYADLASRLGAPQQAPLSVLGLALTFLGLVFKMGAAPAHAWMPDVAEGAPVPAAAFLTVVPKIGAAIAMARLVALFPEAEGGVRMLVAALAVATMTLGNLAAFWQQDVRRLLGWSAVSQSGYALMAVAVTGLTDRALPALIAFLAAYGVANIAAFAAIAHLRGRTALGDFAGLGRARPITAAILILAMLSLVGIPPLAGFVGKLELFLAAIQGGLPWLAVAALVNTVASLFYYARVMGPMYYARPGGEVHVLGRQTLVAASVAGALVLGGGIAAGPLVVAMADVVILP